MYARYFRGARTYRSLFAESAENLVYRVRNPSVFRRDTYSLARLCVYVWTLHSGDYLTSKAGVRLIRHDSKETNATA